MVKSFKNHIFIISILSVIILMVFWVLRMPDMLITKVIGEQKPDFVFINPVIVENHEGKKMWELHASKGELYKRDNVAHMYTVTVNMYTSSDLFHTISAPTCNINIKTKDIVFYNSQIIQDGDKGYVLSSDKLVFNSDKKLIKGIGDVKLVRDGLRVYSKQITGDLIANKFQITKKPRIEIDVDENK